MNSGNPFVNIAEEVYLLTIDSNGEQHQNCRNQRFDVIIASSILMDLALRNVIDTDLENIIPDQLHEIGDIILDEVISEIKENPDRTLIEDWISHISIHGQFFRDEIIYSLVHKNILKQENKKTLWVFSKRKYPLVDNKEIIEAKTRLRTLILSDQLPELRDIVLVSILTHSELLDTILSPNEIKKHQERIQTIAKMDFIGQAISKSLMKYKSSDFLSSAISNILKEKTAEEKLRDHIDELMKKYRIRDEKKLPSWLRKGTKQYEETIKFINEVGTAEITFNPKLNKYSKLNYGYYSHTGGSGA